MKKSAKKVVESLRRYVGLEVLRTKPTIDGDWSYTDLPIKIIGFTPDGRIKYRHIGLYQLILGDQVNIILPLSFTDRNWCTYKKALKAKNNELNKWRGKKIQRVHETDRGDRSFMNEPATLISASKHHMVVESPWTPGRHIILREESIKSEDWQLAE